VRFRNELARVNSGEAPFRFFFGEGETAKKYSLEPHRVVENRQTLTVGGTRFELIPTAGGETNDALLIHLPDAQLTFVGDAFMPTSTRPSSPRFRWTACSRRSRSFARWARPG
jgi:glyoxylase-like metal-dependent hydrolase (beta-lactamase superfamily II)